MALTLEAEQRLENVGLIEFFDVHKPIWLKAAQETHQFLKGNFPFDSTIRPDDVAKALRPVLEVNEELRQKLNEEKLKQKFWISDFTDLIIDRTWPEINGGAL